MEERSFVKNDSKFACGDGKHCGRNYNCNRCPIESQRRIETIMSEIDKDSHPYLGDNVSAFD